MIQFVGIVLDFLRKAAGIQSSLYEMKVLYEFQRNIFHSHIDRGLSLVSQRKQGGEERHMAMMNELQFLGIDAEGDAEVTVRQTVVRTAIFAP